MENSENMTLATELLHELKLSAKRWFIAFIVMVVLEVSTIVGFVWYISLPVEEYDIQQMQEDTKGSLNMIGGSYNGGGEAESSIQEESSTDEETQEVR